MYYRKTNHQTQFLIRCGQLLRSRTDKFRDVEAEG